MRRINLLNAGEIYQPSDMKMVRDLSTPKILQSKIKIIRDRNNQNILALEIYSAKSSRGRARRTHGSPKKTIQRFTQRSVKFIY